MGTFEAVYRRSLENPAGFWEEAAQDIDWIVGKGDRVVISMPMVPQAVIAILACARIGAIHSVVFGGFAADELASRIDHAESKAIVFGSCGIEAGRVVEYTPLINRALELSDHTPQFCIVAQRLEAKAELVTGRNIDWDDAVADAEPADCVPVAATDPLYILYTSGTTAQPKGVVRDNGGHAVALRWSMTNIYDTGPGEVYWAASEMEEVIASHRDVAECAVVGVRDDLKGQVPLGFVVLTAGVERDHSQLEAELVQMVRDQIGPVAGFKQARVVARLPKTRSGEILRATMRRIADGQEYTVPPTIDDPAILDEIIQMLAGRS